MKRLLFGLALMWGLAHFSFADQYPPHAESTRTITTVRVVWLPDIRTVDMVCNYLDGRIHPTKPPNVILGCYLDDTIYAVQPKSFNDEFFLTILGHEFWHALGAEHPPG